jgi:hypothetical protein
MSLEVKNHGASAMKLFGGDPKVAQRKPEEKKRMKITPVNSVPEAGLRSRAQR